MCIAEIITLELKPPSELFFFSGGNEAEVITLFYSSATLILQIVETETLSASTDLGSSLSDS